MNISLLKKIVIISAVITLLSVHALAWSWSSIFGADSNGDSDKLIEIESKVSSLSGNNQIMGFINSNMFDQDVETIEIFIHNNTDQIIKIYYVTRAKDRKGLASLNETAPLMKGVTWTFKPDIDQTVDGLDQAESNLWALEKTEFSISEKSGLAYTIFKALYLYEDIEKENVPSLNDIIKKSQCRQCKKALELIGL